MPRFILIYVSGFIFVSAVLFASFYFYTLENRQTSNSTSEYKESIVAYIADKYKAEGVPEMSIADTEVSAVEVKEVSGFLVFSALKKGNADFATFYADLSDNFNFTQLWFSDTFVYLFPTYNAVTTPTKMFAFVKALEGSAVLQEFTKEGASGKVFKIATDAAERNLEYSSEHGLLAYNKLASIVTGGYPDLLNVSNYDTVLFNPATETVVSTIEGAYMPKWVTGTDFLLYLREDGLYAMDMYTKQEQLLVPVTKQSSVVSTSMFDVSPDGKKIVWTTAKRGVISVFELLFVADTLQTEGVTQIISPTTEYYAPQFSPDSQLYAVQAIDVEKTTGDGRSDPRIEFRSWGFDKVALVMPIDQFEFNTFFINDWIEQ